MTRPGRTVGPTGDGCSLTDCLTRWSIRDPIHKAQSRPRLINRADLVIYQAARQPNLAHQIPVEIRGDIGGSFGPRDPHSPIGRDRVGQLRAPPMEFIAPCRKKNEYIAPASRTVNDPHTVRERGQQIDETIRRSNERHPRRDCDSELLR